MLQKKTALNVKRTPITAAAFAAAIAIIPGTALAQNCSSFTNCAEAVSSYKAGNNKPDRNKNEIPCEKICGSNGENIPR